MHPWWRYAYVAVARAIEENNLDASIAVKLTALGGTFDAGLAEENALLVLGACVDARVWFEMDTDGTPLVEATLKTALACASETPIVTLALQAYLERTSKDLERIFGQVVRPRLVKGAYLGDFRDFHRVQNNFKALLDILLTAGRPFCAGTP